MNNANHKIILRFLSAFLCYIMILYIFYMSCANTFAEEESNQKTSNRFNVVYVLDNSGSMKDTDPNNKRYEAVSHFSSLLANDGNYVGSVVFSDSIKEKHDVAEITSNGDKQGLISEIEGTEIKGWTNIGEALTTAEDMLKQGGDPNLESVILLLTDGNTEMGTDEETQASLDKKAEAIQYARDNGIQIYSICLNANGINSDTLNPQEMQQIADATGGGYAEVTSDDLTDIFQQFYSMIYGTSATPIGDDKIGEDGTFRANFDIPAAGVEEANIIINAPEPLTKIQVTQPDGTVLDNAALSNYMITAGNYSVIKITAPQGGTWEFYSEGTPNATINISMMFNASMSVSAYVDEPKNSYELGDSVRIVAELNTNGTKATDATVLDDYNIVTSVTDQDGNVEDIPVTFTDGKYVSDYSVNDYGTYTFCVKADGNGITSHSEEMTAYVGNTPPTVVKESLSAVGYIWPFIPLDCSVDLSEAVTDKEDKELTYSIDSSSFLEDSYTLDGSTLSMEDFDISKGSFTVRATDSMGASCTFEVYMSSRNVPLYVAIGLAALALIILAVAGIKLYFDRGRYFKGTITMNVSYKDGTEAGETRDLRHRRGRVKLSSFGLKPIGGVNFRKMYFQATGKGYVELRSRKKFRSNMQSKPSKKIRVDRMAIKIYVNQENGESVTLQFEPESMH